MVRFSCSLLKAGFVCTGILLLLIFSGPANAQENKTLKIKPALNMFGADYTARPYYDSLVRELVERRNPQFNFGFLRGRYTMIREYDPLSQDALDALLQQAFIAQTSENNEETAAALVKFQGILEEHMANLAVVAQALSLSKQDRRFGDPDFLAFVRNGLYQNVKNSGTGQTLNQAFDVITMAEETMLLANMDIELLETLSRESGSVFYNIHKVKDKRTGRPFAIFVETTKPMQYLKYKEDGRPDAASPTNIPKQ